jgi:pSer/pThr/pTyr-binding forkhead associated (FHA) protein
MKIGCLTVLRGIDSGKRILLKNLSVFEAGKAQGNHICLRDESVAFNHFRVYFSDGVFSIYDLGSKRGTLVNGQRIEKSRLNHGDVIDVGDVKLRFEIVDESSVEGRIASSAPDSDEADAQAKHGGLLTKTRASVPALVVIDGQDQGKRLTLDGKKSYKIGRSHKTDLRLADAKVSREHCMIEEVQDHHVIVDLESANGTVVNGDRVTKTILKEGDFIRLGFTMLKYDRV